MDENKNLIFDDAAIIIKDAIVRSRYTAAKLVNKELLGLYYAVGKYVSDNSRVGSWGKGAIRQLSENLQKELPGLRGFSEASIKRMRLFYEGWQPVFLNRPLLMDDLKEFDNHVNRPLLTNDLKSEKKKDSISLVATSTNDDKIMDLSLLSKQMNAFIAPETFTDSFYKVGFTHHYEILAKEKSLNGRLFYIAKCAAEFWTVETLKSHLRGDLYSRLGSVTNNFLKTLTESEQAHRAIRAFKDEYFLDFINVEDDKDPDERVLEREIIANIRKFILSFGNKFCFVGNQYRVLVDDEEFFTDLLFFNRELRCLVAIELKSGKFKPSHLGQLNFYLSALDEFVKQTDENPSIGILLCKEANRNIVEFAVRDYTKPMGVATFRTKNEMPERWQKALPDFEDMKKLLESADAEPDGEVGE